MLQQGPMRKSELFPIKDSPAVYEKIQPYQTQNGYLDQDLKELMVYGI